MGGRWVPPGKALPVDRNSKTYTARQERKLGPAQMKDKRLYNSQSRKPSQLENSLEVREEVMLNLPIGLFARIHLGWELCTRIHMGGPWDKPHMDSEPSKARRLAKENLEQIPHKSDLNCHEAMTPSLLVYLATHTVLFFLLTNSLLISLLSVFVGILFCKAERPGSCPWPQA